MSVLDVKIRRCSMYGRAKGVSVCVVDKKFVDAEVVVAVRSKTIIIQLVTNGA